MDVRSARLQEKGIAAGADTFCPPPPPPPHPPPRQPSRAAGGGGSSVLSSPPRRARLLPAWSTPPPLSSLPPLPPARPSQLSRVSGWATRGGGWRGHPRELRPCPRGPGPTDAQGARAGAEWAWRAAEAGRAEQDRLLAGARAGGSLANFPESFPWNPTFGVYFP